MVSVSNNNGVHYGAGFLRGMLRRIPNMALPALYKLTATFLHPQRKMEMIGASCGQEVEKLLPQVEEAVLDRMAWLNGNFGHYIVISREDSY